MQTRSRKPIMTHAEIAEFITEYEENRLKKFTDEELHEMLADLRLTLDKCTCRGSENQADVEEWVAEIARIQTELKIRGYWFWA